MLVLAVDTATPAVTAGVVELPPDPAGPARTRAERVAHDARRHGELLMPSVLDACAEADVRLRNLDAIVVGTGPGPFTGLRVGMVTALALADALDVPVHGVCSLDAIAADAAATACGRFLVVTDARRREVYWAAYDEQARRQDGPHVEAPAALVERLSAPAAVAAAGGSAALTGLAVLEPASPSPRGLVTVAAAAVRAGASGAPPQPLYLRRPDAVESRSRKRVSTP
ncbi:tRNA (adenosine(37)-N6)-threonylcarbamoyltransferase complex dimerization subunit type 1 TsaB [Pseudonocardia asaccharolytica]|uniref:tRNA (Adenosine(37)-N6)-threonylcarbamoyltransferase complex dimerization subunit type 1 TsaB n=1 Tax=Pseudonocardia asaccharolytica DSM 44247 = NBRC 16224 TaxID=1123024 RepID=A0A511CYB5_9PSEU|nr:tRNA (adenosine(37)-N6)-threonylcarbamoyltransferase complex dimerization subunit type 1 TsaB [Pseudonocardia asaccharolytica]GEL16234.1 tRNA (adenosine(37)-N6)-threonylcarbamoyltransferase complex dimerization subunit type 1 TsaB [Pseudonocardia asaccharolytica DSM 44247 = NBRC 16224]